MGKFKFGFLILSLALAGCTTIVGRDLPIVASPVPTGKKPSVLVDFTAAGFREEEKQRFVELMRRTDLFSEVARTDSRKVLRPIDPKSADDYFTSEPQSKSEDLLFRVSFESRDHYHPYCLLTLSIIPCTPPIKWTLGVRVQTPDRRIHGPFSVEEDAVQVTWLFLLIPNSDGQSSAKRAEVMDNMWNNLLGKMRDANLF